ncbi:hypothetical protein [Heyndrickxia sporothermodurans]|uniref:hypothetical protein n=1 Tax=Heyndrickxia sporothermodurans TaxID=46224 RepID=UPI002E1BAE78|nr:hypothetical protein [Heyndrickxia sporothermodurans]MED3697373.1 hypothetical protein [Heyndrickxia sporothermodurans]
MDILTMIYNALIADPYIKEQAYGRIKYYEYPETGDVKAPFIIIDPIDAPNPSDFADNTWLTYDCLFQIEVWSPNRIVTNSIADKVRDVMWKEFGLKQKSGPQEFDKGVFRDARRYEGKIYREDVDGL